MPRYFKKEVPESKLYLPVGKVIPFEFIDRDYGYLSTNDGYIVSELSKMILNGKGGVVEISAEEYQGFVEKKTQLQSQPLQPRQRTTIGPSARMRHELGNPNAVPVAASVVGVMVDGRPVSSFAMGQKSEGLKVDRTFVKPTVGKAK